LDLNFLK
jgi:hypothetical protein